MPGPGAPFTLMKKGLALGGTAVTFLFGALIFTQNKPEPPKRIEVAPSPSTSFPSNSPSASASSTSLGSVKLPVEEKRSWGSFLSSLFGGGSKQTPAPVISTPTPSSSSTSSSPSSSPSSPSSSSPSTTSSTSSTTSSRSAAPAAATPAPGPEKPAFLEAGKPMNEFWQNQYHNYEQGFQDAVKNGDTDAAQKYSRLMVEAKNRS